MPPLPQCDKCAASPNPGCRSRCKGCLRLYHAAYYRRNKAKIISQEKTRRDADPAKHRASKRQQHRKLKQQVIDAYGGECACCGESQIEFLAIDHIRGGGKAHRMGIPGAKNSGAAFYFWLKRNGYPQGELRVLCHNCNQAFGLYGYCPHQRIKSRRATLVG